MKNMIIKPEASFTNEFSQDVIQGLIADKRSAATRKEYEKDLKDFFRVTTGGDISDLLVRNFLALTRAQAVTVALNYKANLMNRGLKESTVNRRLAAIRSLVTYARKIGLCDWSLEDVQGEKVVTYRDTSGVNPSQMAQILSIPDQSTLKGKRDYAILRLLWENALRRNEIAQANISDFNPDEQTLSILGKGRGKQKEIIDLSEKTTQAIKSWLASRDESDKTAPLFVALDNSSRGHRITGTAIYKLTQEVTQKAGITKHMSPHRFRHSAITAALENTNGNVTLVKQLSRHAKVETLLIYNDHREKQQKKVTEVLSNLA